MHKVTISSLRSMTFLSLLLFFSNIISAQEITELQQLLSPFSETKHIKLSYEEKRFSAFFKEPQQYHGYIEYISPDTFIKQVDSPEKNKVVIIQDQLTFYAYDSKSSLEPPIKKQVSLDAYPQFKQLKALFSGLFKGTATELIKYYQFKITPITDGQTHLRLESLVKDPFIQDDQEKSHTNQKFDIIIDNKKIIKINMAGLGGERSELLFSKILIKE
ncbi:MAG: hypothetical protein OQL19_03740 [Gammaproteobacteria bacterium]|nr:hypothetical protein [Gammaproteobacteria bacterium]